MTTRQQAGDHRLDYVLFPKQRLVEILLDPIDGPVGFGVIRHASLRS